MIRSDRPRYAAVSMLRTTLACLVLPSSVITSLRPEDVKALLQMVPEALRTRMDGATPPTPG